MNSILRWIGSQCKLRRTGDMCSLRGVKVITLAAIFCTRCSLRSKLQETPVNKRVPAVQLRYDKGLNQSLSCVLCDKSPNPADVMKSKVRSATHCVHLVFHAQRGVVHNPKILCSCIWRYQTTIDGDMDVCRHCQPLFGPKGNHLRFVPVQQLSILT